MRAGKPSVLPVFPDVFGKRAWVSGIGGVVGQAAE